MEIARLNLESGKIYGLIGNINLTTNNSNYYIVTPYKFKGTVSEYLDNKKASNALKIVFLNDSYLTKTIEELSESELKSINLAKALLTNATYIVLNYFEKGLNYNEKEELKRLLKKLSTNYNKTIVLFSNDITIMWDISSFIITVDNSEVINTYRKKEYFNIPNIDTPIYDFIKLMRDKKINIENYQDPKDLLKAIYRIVGD